MSTAQVQMGLQAQAPLMGHPQGQVQAPAVACMGQAQAPLRAHPLAQVQVPAVVCRGLVQAPLRGHP